MNVALREVIETLEDERPECGNVATPGRSIRLLSASSLSAEAMHAHNGRRRHNHLIARLVGDAQAAIGVDRF
jgi:hypothetical protein